jgi:predicted transcriptional regulator
VAGRAWIAVELTGHFDALPGTIAAATGAYAISVLIMRRSILTEKIARRGRHILQEYTVDPLEFLQAEQVMTSEPAVLPGSMSIKDAVAYFGEVATHRTYPVVDATGRLIAMVSRSDALAGGRAASFSKPLWPRRYPTRCNWLLIRIRQSGKFQDIGGLLPPVAARSEERRQWRTHLPQR